MINHTPLKTIRDLISQTPLIIYPERDARKFQEALAAVPEAKLQIFYRGLSAEERRRFHYAANVCLGYEAWSRLYNSLVVQQTQERLADRLEEAFAHKAEDLAFRESFLEEERLILGEQLMSMETENKALRRENGRLQAEVQRVSQENQSLQEHQKQMEQMIERYRRLIADLRRMIEPSSPQK
jgi:septin family protein